MTLIYRYGPKRAEPRWEWISWGGAFGAVMWLAASALFSWYASSFGSFNKTYGSLDAIIGFMTWMWASKIVILVGEHRRAAEAPGPARSENSWHDRRSTGLRLQAAF